MHWPRQFEDSPQARAPHPRAAAADRGLRVTHEATVPIEGRAQATKRGIAGGGVNGDVNAGELSKGCNRLKPEAARRASLANHLAGAFVAVRVGGCLVLAIGVERRVVPLVLTGPEKNATWLPTGRGLGSQDVPDGHAATAGLAHIRTSVAKAPTGRHAGIDCLLNVPDAGPLPDRILLALDDALRWLEKTDPQKGRLIEMRYFGGMTAEESSTALSVPVHLVRRDLRIAQAWLRREMAEDNFSGAR